MNVSVDRLATEDFCERMWRRAAPLVEAICAHPFIDALGDGTLVREVFAFYLVQDARYLRGFAQALAMASTRAHDTADAAFLASSAHAALTVERQLHARYLLTYEFDGTDSPLIETSPSALAYTSYLQASALHEPFAVLVAALLPCFWVYEHVGATILTRASPDAAHPYHEWISTYGGEQFAEHADQMRTITNRAAAANRSAQPAMERAFLRSTSYEWMFWDSAWRQERWPTERWLADDRSATEPAGKRAETPAFASPSGHAQQEVSRGG